MPVDPSEARLHLLWTDEIHPDCVVIAPPIPAALPVPSAFTITTRSSTPIQRLLMKLCMGLELEPVERAYLDRLQASDRYRSDPDPEVILLCLGRRSGKTDMLTRMGELMLSDGSVAAYSAYPYTRDMLRRAGIDAHAWSSRTMDVGRADVVLFDEVGAMANWSDHLRGDSGQKVCMYSYTGTPIHVPASVRLMAISLDTESVRPGIGVSDSEEFYPPALSDVLDHQFRE